MKQKSSNLIFKFINEALSSELLSVPCPKSINLSKRFSRFLHENGTMDENQADEKSEMWSAELVEKTRRYLEEWELLGVPALADFISKDTLITWVHPEFATKTARQPIDHAYASIAKEIEAAGSDDLLLVATIYLWCAGARKIYVTDGPGDEGIDCIGRIDEWPFRTTAVFMQVKSKSNEEVIGRELLLQEYAKYKHCRYTEKYREYMRSLDLLRSSDGLNHNYIFATNSEFKPSTLHVATNLGVMLRGKRQLAHLISSRISLSNFVSIRDNWKPKLATSLSENVAILIGKLIDK